MDENLRIEEAFEQSLRVSALPAREPKSVWTVRERALVRHFCEIVRSELEHTLGAEVTITPLWEQIPSELSFAHREYLQLTLRHFAERMHVQIPVEAVHDMVNLLETKQVSPVLRELGDSAVTAFAFIAALLISRCNHSLKQRMYLLDAALFTEQTDPKLTLRQSFPSESTAAALGFEIGIGSSTHPVVFYLPSWLRAHFSGCAARRPFEPRAMNWPTKARISSRATFALSSRSLKALVGIRKGARIALPLSTSGELILGADCCSVSGAFSFDENAAQLKFTTLTEEQEHED